MLVTGSASLFANGQGQRACLAHHHDCSNTARLTGCCGIEPGDRSHQAMPPAGTTQLLQPVAECTEMVIDASLGRPGLFRHGRASTSSPRSSPPDLITLFSTFLI
jgi:hypothetical protein